MHALQESFKLAAYEKCWITVTSVVPPYEGELELVGVGDIRAAIRQPCEKSLSAAAELAKAHGALIKTVCEEGEPYERIVDLADADQRGSGGGQCRRLPERTVTKRGALSSGPYFLRISLSSLHDTCCRW